METPTRNDVVSVGVTVVELAQKFEPPNKRQVLYIRNTSSGIQTITVVLGDKPAVNGGGGIVIKPNDCVIDSNSDGYECFQGRITAISDIAGGQVSIYER